MAPPRPRSKRQSAPLDDDENGTPSRKKVAFKAEASFFDDHESDDEVQTIKRIKGEFFLYFNFVSEIFGSYLNP